jgi:hypothetical protein
MAGVTLVFISEPNSGSGVGHQFCVRGTADGKVTAVQVELYITGNPSPSANATAAVSGGLWKTPMTLPSFDPNTRYELKAFSAAPRDGSSVNELRYDSSIADQNCT